MTRTARLRRTTAWALATLLSAGLMLAIPLPPRQQAAAKDINPVTVTDTTLTLTAI